MTVFIVRRGRNILPATSQPSTNEMAEPEPASPTATWSNDPTNQEARLKQRDTQSTGVDHFPQGLPLAWSAELNDGFLALTHDGTG